MKRFLLLTGFLVAGCAVGPDYQRPEIAMQARFVGGNADAIGAVAREAWWQSYNDAALSALVTRGLAQNLDVMEAIEAIRQAQAEVRASGINAAADGALTATGTLAGGDAISGTSSSGAGALGASFVIDLFGGIQRDRESAAASLVLAQAEAQTVRLAWLAELLAAYSDARFYQEALALTRDSINARAETVSITQSQFDAGAATEYQLAEAQALSLAQENYRNGAITLLDLLETDRNTATARISAASVVNDAAQAWAALKIAIGAGAAVTKVDKE